MILVFVFSVASVWEGGMKRMIHVWNMSKEGIVHGQIVCVKWRLIYARVESELSAFGVTHPGCCVIRVA
jgi:hypothetical protein